MNDNPKVFLQHLLELRKRFFVVAIVFIIAFVLFYTNVQTLMHLLFYPLKNSGTLAHQVIYTSLPEAFLSEINIAIFFSLLLCLPVLLVQGWIFLKPALYAKEKFVTRWVFILIPGLFYSGVFFVQMLILPKAIDFFIAFEANADLKFMPKLSEYVSFCERFMIVFGVGFELPIILWLLVSFNLISSSVLKKRWRIVVLCICAVSAVITPPDALSMLALVVPLILLYVMTIVVIHYCEKRKVIQKDEIYA